MNAAVASAMNTPLFTRFVRRRNFASFPFWVSASPETCSLLAARARDYAASQGMSAGVLLADLLPDEIGLLREQGVLPERPVSFDGKRDFKMFFPVTNPDKNIAEFALFGEVEHWTHVTTLSDAESAGTESPGRNPSADIPFARSATYGFLTSNPVFAGTGLQIETGLHLPALAATRKIPAVQKALGALGFELQPLTLRSPGSAESGYFRLLSRGGMDLPEESLHKGFAAKTKSVLAAEAGALEQWHKREPNPLEDRVHRALRLLQEARRMDYAELLSLTSYARIGVYLGIFPPNLLESAETLRIEAQPFHVRKRLHEGVESPSSESPPGGEERVRADVSRELLAGIETL